MEWLVLGGIAILIFLFLPGFDQMSTGSIDRSEYIHPGPKQPKPTSKPKQHVIRQKADWFGENTGLPYIDKVTKDGVIESQFAHKIKVNKNPKLTPEEIQSINSGGREGKTYDNLDMMKAPRLKIFWAQNYSAAKTKAEINEEGFSLRVIQDHWAIFNYFYSASQGRG